MTDSVPPHDFIATRIYSEWCVESYTDAGDAWLREYGADPTVPLMIAASDMDGVVRAIHSVRLTIMLKEGVSSGPPSRGRFPRRDEADSQE